MKTQNQTETPTYRFLMNGKKGNYEVSFSIEDGHLSAGCTCRYSFPCQHVEYILAGRTTRLIGGDVDLQGVLLKAAENTVEGRALMKKAKIKFAGETHCRRCNSTRIVKIKSSLTARFFSLFKETSTHMYFCKNCKWTW
ncbi:MAG TPA: hypothetical protein VL093_09810 [Flavipsychrobacter sp.]|nr:hypothetical protein [Flavipsychrobacter sp.]